MDNLGNNSSQGGNSDKSAAGANGPSSPAPAPATANPAGGAPAVSRAPLNLGATGTAAPAPHAATVSPTPAGPVVHPAPPSPAGPAAHPVPPATAPRVQAPQIPIHKPVAVSPAPAGRIANCKTFFTKLHPGAIKFLDDQITAWLKENPSVVIKHTNMTTGDIVDKKTEPNILITVWY